MSRESDLVKLRKVGSGPFDDLSALEGGETLTASSNYGEMKEHAPRAVVPVTILVIVWYLSAAIAITTSKKTMVMLPLPFMLCTSQFIVASIVVGVYTRLSKKHIPMQSASRSMIFKISYSYTFGFVFTNIAFSLGKLSLLG